MSDTPAERGPTRLGAEDSALAGRWNLALNKAERRRHPRFPMACPIWFIDAEGTTVLRSRTRNVSPGGALAIVPAASPVQVGQKVAVRMALPHETQDTYVLTSYEGLATVVRTEPAGEAQRSIGVGLRFEQEMSLEFAK